MLKSKQTKQLTDQDMQDYVDKFMDIYRKDKNSRYRSHDHVHCVYLKNRHDNSPVTLDYVALHLFAFLGSWGMLCRRSFLMLKDYLFLIPVIEILNQPEYDGLCDIDLTDANPNLDKSRYIATVIALIGELKEYFMSQTYYKIEKDKETGIAKHIAFTLGDVHDTVIGKILLATLGCIPAYDRYVVAGMKAEGLCGILGKRNLSDLVDYSRAHDSILKKIMASVNADVQRESGYSTLVYPVAKILDMLFWEYGYDIL